MELPLFEARIGSDGIGIDAIALVKTPAMEELWQTFGQTKLKFQTVSEERRRIGGFALVPDRKVYRSDENGEYNIVFRKDTVDEAAELFFKNNKLKSVNLNHDKSDSVNDVFVAGGFQVDRERGILSPKGFDPDIPDGALYLEYKIDNDILWFDWIKEGKFKGYSIEGLFALNRVNMKKQEKKGALEEIKALLQKVGEKVGLVHRDGSDGRREATLQDGTVIVYSGDLTTGTPVNMITPEGEEVALVDGTHELSEGDIIVTVDGIVTEIQSKELIDNTMELQQKFDKLQAEFTAFKKGIEGEKLALAASEKAGEQEKKFKALEEKIESDKKEILEVITEFTKSGLTPPAQKPAHSTEYTPSWKKKLDNLTNQS